jgi:hypothetical protein
VNFSLFRGVPPPPFQERLPPFFRNFWISHWSIYHSYEEVIITDEGLQDLCLFSALMAFEHGCHTCYDMVPRVLLSHPKGSLISSPLKTNKGHVSSETYSNQEPWKVPVFNNRRIVYILKRIFDFIGVLCTTIVYLRGSVYHFVKI